MQEKQEEILMFELFNKKAAHLKRDMNVIEYGNYTRYKAIAEPIRYKKQDGVYFYNKENAISAKIMCAGDLMCEPVMSKAVCYNDKFLFE